MRRLGLILFLGFPASLLAQVYPPTCPTDPANPITWYLSGVRFSDGGTASGSFVYDAINDAYSSVNITLLVVLACRRALHRFPERAGRGALPLSTNSSYEGTCGNYLCSDPSVTATRFVVAGSLSTTPAPASPVPAINPGGLVHLILSLAAIGAILIRQQSRA
jgi:hypothetical protein